MFSSDTNDYKQFITIYEQANENVGGLPEECEVLADNGYNTDENCKIL